jgi:ABC-type nitrate/sulfonate/bicarbonate transport system permease component
MMPGWAKGAVLPILLVAMWEIAARTARVKYEAMSSPSEVLRAGLRGLADGSILLATWQTLEAAVFGLVLAIVFGVVIGTLAGISRTAELATMPTVEALRPIPSVAFIPLTLLMFGYGLPMEGLIVAYACIWPVLIATADGVRRIEPRLMEVAAALEMSEQDRFTKIILPAALGRVLVGIRIAVGFALVVAVTVEIAVNPRGLGYSLIIAQQQYDIGFMYAQLLWLGLLGLAINAAIARLGSTDVPRAGGAP